MKDIKNILIALLLAILTLPLLVLGNPDLDNDGNVDISDLIIVARNFGTSNSVADTDSNGIVDIFDIVYVASRLGANLSTGELIAHWNFNGNLNDVINDNQATAYGTSYVEGVSGNALSFDGVDDYLEVGHDSSLNLDNELTVMAWIKVFDDGSANPIIVKATSLSSGFHFAIASNDRLYFRTGNSGSYSDVSIAYSSYYGAWHHIAAVYDGSNEIIYVDGEEKIRETPSISSVGVDSNVLRIGRSTTGYWGGAYFNGLVDEVRIFNKALTQQEVQESMAGATIPPPTLCTGTCKASQCSSYDNCASASGECSSGYCCSGSCTTPPPPPDGNIIYAAGCTRDQIQTAVNSASSGDTVELPACNQNGFPGTVTVPANIEIRGQGKTQTMLSRNSADGTNPMFRLECSSEDRLKFSGLTLDGVGDDSTLERGLFIMGSCKDLRIWNTKFKDLGYYGIFINNYNKGVIWDCDFVHCFATGYGYGVVVEAEVEGEYPGGSMGDWSWSQPLSLGTDDAIFIEDSTASRTKHVVTAARGSRYVFRYNNILADGPLQYPVDTHGPHPTGSSRGARQIEVYNNFIDLKHPQWSAMAFFSGRGAIFNNTIVGTTTTNPVIYFGHPCCGRNDCSPYPEVDQVTDLYLWGNDYDGGVATDSNTRPTTKCNDEVETLYIRGRDYFFYPRPGYTPYPYPHPLRSN